MALFFYGTIATLISSHVIFTCKDRHVFARKLTWYFTSVYIINTFCFLPKLKCCSVSDFIFMAVGNPESRNTLIQIVFMEHQSSDICVPRQRSSGHIGVPNQSSGNFYYIFSNNVFCFCRKPGSMEKRPPFCLCTC